MPLSLCPIRVVRRSLRGAKNLFFGIVLVSGVCLITALGVAQDSTTPLKAPGLSLQNTGCVPSPPGKPKKTKIPTKTACPCDDNCERLKTESEKSVLLVQARTQRELGNWDKSAELYAKVLQVCPKQDCPTKACLEAAQPAGKHSVTCTQPSPLWSCSPLTLSPKLDPRDVEAVQGFCVADSITRTWWWNWGGYFPPLRWAHTYPRRFLWAGLVLLAVLITPKLLGGRGLLYWIATLLALLFRPRFRGRMAVIAPVKLTPDAQVDLFSQALAAAGNELNKLVKDPDLGAKPVTMLALPSTLSTAMQIPTISGFDIGGMARFLFSMGRYFGWRLESALGFSPALKAEDSHPSGPARMRAFATVRWGWHVRRAVEVEREVWDQYDVDALAVAVIARSAEDRHFLRIRRTGSDRFSGSEAFGLFIEGLRALQCYGAESDQAHPRQPLLNWYIHQAIERLREAVERYPRDILSQYYLGIATATLNQHIYVARLCELSKAVGAHGRHLALRDMRNLPRPVSAKTTLAPAEEQKAAQFRAKAPAEADSEIAQARREALDAIELDREDWPLLHDADFRFEQTLRGLAQDNPFSQEERTLLQRTTMFNLADVYSRLGTKELIELAVNNLLAKIPASPVHTTNRLLEFAASLQASGQATRLTPRQEARLLDLKVASLRLSLMARCAIFNADAAPSPLTLKGAPATEDPSAAIARLVDHLTSIREAIADEGLYLYASDLVADFCTRLGYVYYDLALHPGARPTVSADEALNEAEKWLRQALGLKANWNPAQIYLALAFRVHAGVFEAIGDSVAQKRYSRKADRLFTSLVGTPVPPVSPASPPSWRVAGTFAQPGAQPTDPHSWRMDINGTVQPESDPE